MKMESVSAKSCVLFLVFLAMCFFFTFLKEPLAEVNNWILLTFHEGRVTKGAAAADAPPPKVKLEQLKGVPSKGSSSSTAATGATTFDKDYKGVPVLTVDIPAKGEISKGDVYLNRWAVLGPIAFAKHPERKDDFCFMESIDIPMVDDELKLDGSQILSYAKWINVVTNASNGKIDLRIPYSNNVEFAVAYMVTFIDCAEEIKDVSIKIGSDDYAKIWVNGDEVLKYNVKCRGGAPDTNTSDTFTLKKGFNTIIFKCVQISGGWEAYARLVDSDGNRLCVKKEVRYEKK